MGLQEVMVCRIGKRYQRCSYFENIYLLCMSFQIQTKDMP
jgi:hypothetical protein